MTAKASRRQTSDDSTPWRTERDAYARAFGGAFLFGMPLLFTMEMWWIGEFLERPRLAAFSVIVFFVNVGLAYFAGFRSDDSNLQQSVWAAVEAMAVGVVGALIVLLSLNRIHGSDSLDGTLGMIALQALPLSIGASVATAVFSSDKGRAGDSNAKRGGWRELWNDVGATLAGAIFLGLSVAPTQEVPMLAVGLGLPSLLAIVALTMIATYIIVFASGFDPEHRDRVDSGLFQRPFSETVLAYLVSLTAAFVLLVCFGQISWGDPMQSILQEVIVLGVPASLGGAAGRIIT